MIDIPTNNASELEAEKMAAYQAELDTIAQQFLSDLKTHNSAVVDCCEHMIGYNGSKKYHHMCDAVEVARQFKEKGYHCYYYNYYNGYGVNQRAVCVCKTAMLDSELQRGARRWYSI